MILGIELQPAYLIIGGLFVGTVVVLQMLVGLRKIRFKGRRHMQVHKGLAWLLLVAAVFHGFVSATYVEGWRILS